MPTNYDQIAHEYQRAKHQPWRWHIEHYTLFQIIGDLHGKDVLDLACGEGFYTRYVKRDGAARVVGVDLSAGMIDLARQEEAKQPLGIEYQVGDARKVQFDQPFDLVVAAYLLNYASTREELLEMCQAVARSLKPGCRFVTVNSNPDFPATHNHSIKKYGLEKILSGAQKEGTPYNWRFHLTDKSFEVTNYYLSTATHDWALRAAGFRDIRTSPPRLSPAGEKEFGKEFWREFLENPPVVFIEGVK